MSNFQSVFLGFIQGLTEFLPVSSSGHLVITQNLMKLTTPPVYFDIILHVATLVAVIIYFRKELLSLNMIYLKLIIIASIPTGIIGLLLNSHLESIFSSPLIIAYGFLVTAFLLILAHKKSQTTKLTQKLPSTYQAVLIGIIQGLAIFPGISRSGSTIAIALLLGLSAKVSFTFSFLISIPAILAALLLQIVGDNHQLTASPTAVILGFSAALISGVIALAWLKKIIKAKKLFYFAIYTALLAVVIMI